MSLCETLSFSAHEQNTVIIYIYIKLDSKVETLSYSMNYSHLWLLMSTYREHILSEVVLKILYDENVLSWLKWTLMLEKAYNGKVITA